VSQIVRIFGRKTRTYRTLRSHQIRVFRRRSEQLVGREARRELEEAMVHVLGAKPSPQAALTINKHQPSHLTVAGLHCRSPPIKVSINTFPSSLWSHRSKPHQKPITVAQENSTSGEPGDSCISCEVPMTTQRQIDCEEPMATQRQIGSKHPNRDTGSLDSIRAVDPIANDQRLMKSVDLWAGAGGPGPRCRGHILQVFLKENNSINPKNHWNLRIFQKHPWTFLQLYFSPYNFTFRSLFNFL
jgi:hypothetical protein